MQVERVAIDAQPIPGCLRDEGVGVEMLAERVDIALDELRRGGGWTLSPELVHEPRGRDDLVRVEEQHAEQRAGLRCAEPH